MLFGYWDLLLTGIRRRENRLRVSDSAVPLSLHQKRLHRHNQHIEIVILDGSSIELP